MFETKRYSSHIQPASPAEEDTGFIDFPLFTTPLSHALTLRTPTPPPSQEDIYLKSFFSLAEKQNRPDDYYFYTPTEDDKARFREIAVEGDEVVGFAEKVKWCGRGFPWRVMEVGKDGLVVSNGGTAPPINGASIPGIQNDKKADGDKNTPKHKKCKPGKKRRIFLRLAAAKRQAAKLAAEERKKQEAEERKKAEEEARMKRLLRNREKKAKKRAREKVKKLAGAGRGDAGEKNVDEDGVEKSDVDME